MFAKCRVREENTRGRIGQKPISVVLPVERYLQDVQKRKRT